MHTVVTTGQRKVNAMKFMEKKVLKTLHHIVYEYNRSIFDQNVEREPYIW
jgi:hypothetical protein